VGCGRATRQCLQAQCGCLVWPLRRVKHGRVVPLQRGGAAGAAVLMLTGACVHVCCAYVCHRCTYLVTPAE
jgi:hypothetical protein